MFSSDEVLDVGCVFLFLLFAPAALAAAGGSTTYTYSGNAYNTCAGTYCTGGPYALSVTFTTTLTGSALANLPFGDITSTVTSFSFTDRSGLTINNSNGSSGEFYIGTDASGNVTAWLVGVCGSTCNVQMQTNWQSTFGFIPGADFSETTVSFEGSYGLLYDDPGTWSPPIQIATTASGLAYSRVTQTFNGTVTLTNIGSSAINGPLQIILMNLANGVTLTNATGSFSGAPYITMPVSNGGQVIWTLQNVTFSNGETANGTFVVDSLPTSGFYTVESWDVTFHGLPAGYPTGSSGTHNPAACSTEGCAYICSDPWDVSCSANTGYYTSTPVQDALDAGASTAAIGAGTGLTTGIALLANNLVPPTVGSTIPLLVSTATLTESYIFAYNFNTAEYADFANLVTGSIVQTAGPTVTTAGLAPGQSVALNVEFKNPSNTVINFTPAVYSGNIN